MQESNLLMYTTEDGLTKIEATFVNDTVWLSIEQMAELFQRDRSVIGKHIRNIFKEGELKKESVKTYQVDYYNLDVIISVGYRTKGTVTHKQALEKAHEEYKKYKKKEESRLSSVEQHFFDSINELEGLEEKG